MDKLKTRKFSGFTLVELIVVITILVILGTIAFIQLQGFSGSARDGRRVSDMSNITKAIDVAIIAQGNAPVPTNPVSYTGWSVTIQMGTVTNTTIAKMNGDFSDPLTKGAYNYSILGNGSHYQLGIDFENPIAHASSPGRGLVQTAYADTITRYSKLSGNYAFDPSLPSLFVLSGTVNSASGGIFSPDVCFIMNNASVNTFGSPSAGCVAKKDMSLKNLDNGLVGYWDMESLTSSGLLKDVSGNGNDGAFLGGMVAGSASVLGLEWRGMAFDWLSNYIRAEDSPSLKKQKSWTVFVLFKTSSFWTWPVSSVLWVLVAKDGIGWWVNRPYSIRVSTDKGLNASIADGIHSDWWWSFPNIVMDGSYKVGVMTWDGNFVRLYLNGIKQSESVQTVGDINETTPLIFWSILQGSGYHFFNGVIDDIKIYNRALSDSEIRQQAKTAGF